MSSDSLPGPLPPEVAVADIDEARIEMVHDLHRAVFGATWARPESPAVVWNDLLHKVRRRSYAERTGRQLPAMPDRWARVYEHWTANPSWSNERDATEPQQSKHQIAVVRYVAVPESVVWLNEEES